MTAFQAAVIEERSAGTGLNKYKALQQFSAGLSSRAKLSGHQGMRCPGRPRCRHILEVCEGRGFVHLRDQAMVRMFYNTGGRLAEMGDLLVPDVDLDTDSVILTGKGGKQRQVRFGAKTASALRRYVRAADALV